MVYQITEGGVFHADPHPGNVMLLTDGRLALLDFGSVGRLDAQQRAALQNLLLAVGRGDPAALRDALLELVTRTVDIDEQQLERALGQFMARHLAVGLPASAEIFTDLFRLAARFELAIPPEVGTVLRALATLEGTLTELSPDFDIVTQARQYAAAHVTMQLTPETVPKTAADELLALLPVLRLAAAPARSHYQRAGTGQAQPQREAVRRRARPRGGHRPEPPVPADVAGCGVRHHRGAAARCARRPRDRPGVSLNQVIGYNLLLVASILVLRVLFTIFRNR